MDEEWCQSPKDLETTLMVTFQVNRRAPRASIPEAQDIISQMPSTGHQFPCGLFHPDVLWTPALEQPWILHLPLL